MQRLILAFIAGGLFGSGLFISGMTDTSKVQGWLDVFGNWDPTLAFVMGGAILPMAVAWAFTKGRKPLVGGEFPTPPEPKLGRNLVAGSVMFGAGWGLAGLCPARRAQRSRGQRGGTGRTAGLPARGRRSLAARP